MFGTKTSAKSTLLCGPVELINCFVFEAAIHWAEEGARVFYLTPAPLTSLPATFHDRNAPTLQIFKRIQFLYVKDYEALVKQLVELHTFANLPSVILVDNLQNYVTNNLDFTESEEVLIGKLSALLIDTINAISRFKNGPVHLFASVNLTDLKQMFPYTLYFHNIWKASFTDQGNNNQIELSKVVRQSRDELAMIFKYKMLSDKVLILQRILQEVID